MSVRRLLVAVPLALTLIGLCPTSASAHPLGNFTVNQYSRLLIGTDAIELRYIVDMAEIPAFRERQQIDTGGDDHVSAGEADAYLASTVRELVRELRLVVDGEPLVLELTDAEVSFPPGQGGLPTLRLVIDLRAALPPWAEAAARQGSYSAAGNFDEQVGWREIVVRAGPGVELLASDVPADDLSAELERYPEDRLFEPLDVTAAAFRFAAAPDASESRPAEDVVAGAPCTPPDDPLASLVGGELTPLAAMLAIGLSVVLGAQHALTPGHGKTLVAAYLIGSRGTIRQALALGLTVAATHTGGILVLGLLTLTATELILPEQLIRWLAVASGFIVIALGAALVWQHLRRRAAPSAQWPAGHGHDGGHAHPHPHPPAALSPRNVVALGLVGGLVPSYSALLLLLVAFTVDRLAFGVGLILAFGLGMAVVLGGIGIGIALFRERAETLTDGWRRAPLLGRLATALPLLSGIVVIGVGLFLTAGALAPPDLAVACA